MIGDLEKYDRIGEHSMDMRMAEDDYAGGVTLCAFCGRPFGDSIGIDGMCLDCTYHEYACEVGGEFDLRKLILARLEPDDKFEIGDDPFKTLQEGIMKIRIKYEWVDILGRMRYVAYNINSLSEKEVYLYQGDDIDALKRDVARLLNEKQDTKIIEEYEI